MVAIHLPNTACKTCSATETQRHILWECPAAQEVWEGVVAVLKRTSTGGAAITYESALWGSFIQGKIKNPDAWKWRHNEAPHFDQLNQTWTHIKHLHQELFDALRGCTLAEIWKARCAKLFNDMDPLARATISKVWSKLIVSLAARLDTLIKRGEEGKIAKEKELWPFFRGRSEAGEEEWMWKPPIWIWQHMFRNNVGLEPPRVDRVQHQELRKLGDRKSWTRTPTWGTELGFKWLDTEETTRYIGFQVGRQYDPEPQNQKAVTKLRDQLKFWHLAWSNLVPGSMLEHGQANDPGNEPTHLNLCLERLLLHLTWWSKDKNEHTRKNWATDEQWLFLDTKLKMTKAHMFSGKLFKLWSQFKCKLERKPPRTKEQLDQQPIFLSKLFAVKEADTMIQPNQTANNYDQISAFYRLTISEHRMRKFQTAFLAAKHTCLKRLNLQEDQYHQWWKVDKSIDLPDISRAKPIRVIQMEKKTANVNPLIPEKQYARLYWFHQQTLDELKWDPTEWHWRGTMCKDFFQYKTKLGRKLIRVLTQSSLIQKAKAQQIHSRNHSHCINKIWKGHWSAKNRYFMWLAQQEHLPSLAAIHLPNTACKTCGTIETQ
ncbi:hypothetical protein SELMODRAFT_412221 [Selaginella moellendorffii]|uniref:Uncharacterized protein n=1 Tax=Selaginella moellendorffii TaxID=88036 RepID=D8RKG9_SELML|nr:hypothetical protein SELMODRAFT_412221 [Selaginella moellendorffii]